jgi:hypothetical protein
MASASTVRAQRDLSKVLAAAKSVDCDYTVLGTGNWAASGNTIRSTPSTLKVSFFNIDTQESTAEIKSESGQPYYIVVRHVGNYLHLMQVKGEGPIYTTTLYAKEIKPGRFLSVHTRHEYTDISLPGYTSRPEQYIGDCAIGQS